MLHNVCYKQQESSDINSVLAGATCDYGVQTSNVTLFRSANALPHVLVDCAHCGRCLYHFGLCDVQWALGAALAMHEPPERLRMRVGLVGKELLRNLPLSTTLLLPRRRVGHVLG